MLTNEDELRRITYGPFVGEKPRGIALISVLAHCVGNAPEILVRCREVMRIVLAQDVERWPTDQKWLSLLPGWFVTACVDDEALRLEAQRWLELSDAERAAAVSGPWSVGGWTDTFLPHQRQWFWWDASTLNGDAVRVLIEIFADPFSWGALEWLLKASGAVGVERDQKPIPSF